MGSTRNYQDRLWNVDPAQIAHDMVTELISRHDKRVASTVQYREKLERKKQHPFGEVLKFVAEEKAKQ